jgi:signal transduction histidine kinase
VECALRASRAVQSLGEHGHANSELREQTLLELAKRDTSDLKATCRAVTEAATTLVGVARASVWRFVEDELVCDDLFLRDEARHTSGQSILLSSCPTYFANVSRSLSIRANNAHTDPRTAELDAWYLRPLGIGAMLDTPIWKPGGVGGVLCCEHVGGARHWTRLEERDAARLADLVERSMERSTRRAAEERSKVILEAIPQYVLVVDERGDVIDASAMARRTLLEEGGTSFAGRFDALEIRTLAGELLPVSRWPTERARRGETVRAEILELSSRVTGQKRWLRATSAPVKIGESTHGAVVIYEEVAEEIRIERVKREVLSAVAHELRTPTTIVKGYAQRLQNVHHCSPDEKRALVAMERASARIERLAEALVDLTAITFGRVVLSLEHVDLADVVLDAVHLSHGTSTHIVHFTPNTAPVRVFVDPMRIQRVVCELIENATRCSNVGSPIDIELGVDEGRAHLLVRDHGVGIPERARAHVFEPFFRAHVGTPENVGGLGIGLFLTREIIARHGGTIAFDSVEGGGTTFTITLPLDREPP